MFETEYAQTCIAIEVEPVMSEERKVWGEGKAMMRAQAIRQGRYGAPCEAFKMEYVPIPEIAPDECLIRVMAAGINYNGIWAAKGEPVDVISLQKSWGSKEEFHIAGSDASGVVVAVGADVVGVEVGAEVVMHCGWWDAPDQKDEILDISAKIWGYEINYGAFAEFAKVKGYAVLPKPPHLSWAEAASYMLCGATAYRMLHGFHPHTIQKGDVVLIWGGSGGVGCMATQLVKAAGGIAVAVVAGSDKGKYCIANGADGVLDRSDYDHWGIQPDPKNAAEYARWLASVKKFRNEIWDIAGFGNDPKIVIEHPGEDTFPTSAYICARAGMVVICAGTSGYVGTFDIRHHWMKQKRFQGSHFANSEQCRALNNLVSNKLIAPNLGGVYPFSAVGEAHQLMHEGQQPPGNMVISIGCDTEGVICHL